MMSSCELLSKKAGRDKPNSSRHHLSHPYKALSTVLTVTPDNFKAVAVDSFKAGTAGSLSDLDENLCEATAKTHRS